MSVMYLFNQYPNTISIWNECKKFEIVYLGAWNPMCILNLQHIQIQTNLISITVLSTAALDSVTA